MQKLGPHHKKFIDIYQKAVTKLKIIYKRILKSIFTCSKKWPQKLNSERNETSLWKSPSFKQGDHTVIARGRQRRWRDGITDSMDVNLRQ